MRLPEPRAESPEPRPQSLEPRAESPEPGLRLRFQLEVAIGLTTARAAFGWGLALASPVIVGGAAIVGGSLVLLDGQIVEIQSLCGKSGLERVTLGLDRLFDLRPLHLQDCGDAIAVDLQF